MNAMNAQLFDETTKTHNIQGAAEALMLLNIADPKLNLDDYCDKAERIWEEFLPNESDRSLTPEEEELSNEMMDSAMELSNKMQREFTVRLVRLSN